ncbi:MAG: TlpA family protein disulfide reductase [Acidimicrobiales bacterium]
MNSRRRLVLALAGAAVAIVAAVVAFRPSGDQVAATGAAPTFSTVDLQGKPVRLADYRGRTVLLNFWASWCIPCRKEFPLLRDVEGKIVDGTEVAVLGIVFNDDKVPAAAFMREQKATWPGLQDPGGRVADAYDVGLRPGIPVTVLIDRDGRLAERHVGELREEDLERLLAPAVTTTTSA